MKSIKYALLLSSIFLFPVFASVSLCPDSKALAGPQANELHGVFLGKSSKAKLISIRVEDKTLLVSYDDKTEGIDEVDTGDNVLVRYHGEDLGKTAVEVIPEPVKIPAGVTEMEPEELLATINDSSKQGKYLLVDCRPFDFYAETHLPTAVSIPWTEKREEKLAGLPADKNYPLIFYCLGGTCQLGPNSAALAAEAGYKNVRVLLAELSEWQELGGQLFSSDIYITHGNVVLVDLRSRSEVEAGHIPGAVNIAGGEISEAEYDFPTKKSAPVIVYGNGSESDGAVAAIRGWGFHQVSLVDGGYGGWVARGNPVQSGKVSSRIKWQRQLDDGEVSIEDFEKVVDGKSDTAVIVDVRTGEESAKGSFDGAIRIPMSELEVRLAEVPVDKEIYLHCTTGARAKMAWTYLTQHRNKVRYLHAKVSSREGKMNIRP